MQNHTISFSLDGVFGFLRAVFEFFASLARPIGLFVREVAGQGWFGAAFVFMLFFMLMLIRQGAKSGRNIAVYGGSLKYIGQLGSLMCLGVLLVLSIEHAVEPIVTIVLAVCLNSLTGGSPGVFQTAGFLLGHSPARDAFLADLSRFYGESHTALPIGFRATFMMLVAFGSMFLVGKAASSLPQRETS